MVTLGGGPGARSRRPWCTRDLRDTDQVPARLRTWPRSICCSAGPGTSPAPSTPAASRSPDRIGFDAFIDLVDAATPSGTTLDLAHDPVHVARRLADAAHVLTRPGLDQATDAASRLLSYTGPHAPLGPTSRIVAAPYNPLLAAVQLHGVRDQLSRADQLMFRTGHPAAALPSQAHPRQPAPTPPARATDPTCPTRTASASRS